MIVTKLVPAFLCVTLVAGARCSAQEATTTVLPIETTPAPTTAPDAAAPDVPITLAEPRLTSGSPEIDALLDEIEVSGRGLKGFSSKVRYETIDALLGDKVIRTGTLLYDGGADLTKRRFAILFDAQIENRRKREKLDHFIFADGWLVEIDHEHKQFVKRQIVAPGEEFDPFKLGEGPIPLPIGQSRNDVLSQFEVSTIELPNSGALARLRDYGPVDGLRLVPRPGRVPREEFRHVDLFYDGATRLPVGVHAVEVNGNEKIARLDDLLRDQPLTPEEAAKLDIRDPDEHEWQIDIRPYGS